MNGKSGELSHSSDACTCIHNSVDLHVNLCGSAQCCGCVVNGNVAMAAVKYYSNETTENQYTLRNGGYTH